MSTSKEPTRRRLGRPPGSVGADRSIEILQAAQECFALAGYHSTTNQKIATRAGITTGALYHYFSSKEELYSRVFASVRGVIFDTFRRNTKDTTNLLDALDQVLDASVTINRDDPSVAAFWINLAAEARRHPELAPLAEIQRVESHDFWMTLVQRSRDAGSVGADADDETLVNVISSVTTGLSRMSVIALDPAQHRLTADALKALIRGQLFS